MHFELFTPARLHSGRHGRVGFAGFISTKPNTGILTEEAKNRPEPSGLYFAPHETAKKGSSDLSCASASLLRQSNMVTKAEKLQRYVERKG